MLDFFLSPNPFGFELGCTGLYWVWVGPSGLRTKGLGTGLDNNFLKFDKIPRFDMIHFSKLYTQ